MKLKISIIGNLGKDATVKVIDNTTEVVNFSVCHTEKFKGQDGVQREIPYWVECSFFRPVGKSGIAAFLGKGSVVEVVGKPTVDHYFKDGQKEPVIVQRCLVSEVVLISSNKVGGESSGSANNQNGGTAAQPQNNQAPKTEGKKRNALAEIPVNPADDMPF
jgi:single-strand DNA-binding protein